MHDLSLSAGNINNLTDARFFAAYMPVYMSVPIINQDFDATLDLFEAIQPWIDGVTWALELRKDDVQHLSRLNEAPISAIVYHGIEGWDFSLNENRRTIVTAELNELQKIDGILWTTIDALVLQGTFTVDRVRKLKESFFGEIWIGIDEYAEWPHIHSLAQDVTGILVQGSDEEQVGLKSFEEVDEFLSKIFD